ncbi:hypothetical protein [Reyranella sp.]|uniref:hypothetical protein n=1 Tax=Reyranella sp. TaxID=1929291 RepID=UPI003BA9A5EB
MKSDERPEIRLHAYAETEAKGKGPTLLQVYIVNLSPEPLEVLNDLDSINMPPRPPRTGETIDDADLMHVDFGTSGTGAFVGVAPGEAVKVTLILDAEQADLLARVKAMKTTVKWRRKGERADEVQSVLLPATVHVTRP